MILQDDTTYYDILDLKPDASPDEIREAYLRTKSAYQKDSLALYTLVSAEETKEILRMIEESYHILSSPEKRREYDRYHGLLGLNEDFAHQPRPPANKKIISIDRVPPMESAGGSDELLVAPSTDFTSPDLQTSSGIVNTRDSTFFIPVSHPPQAGDLGGSSTPYSTPHLNPPASDALMEAEIKKEMEWRGTFLRKVREAQRVSVEEMSGITRITKTYVLAIEEENFTKLPAAVYLRGFVIQVAKVLKLPHDQVAAAYMARYYEARPDQARTK